MNIFVSGGAGFIGSHLIDRLIQNGHHVICVDKLLMGEANISHLKSNPLFTFYHNEINDQQFIDNIFEKYKPKIVYHLAANSDIQKGGTNPNIDFNDTFLTTYTLLESMRKFNIKNLFFASTSAVYGNKPNILLTENIGDLNPISYYGGAKLSSEAIISSYTAMCNLKTIIFRFPNVIGPRLTHGVIFDFMNKLKQTPDKLVILGDGTQCKPYIYVDDLINAIELLTNYFPQGKQIYNVSVNSGGTTVTKIAEILVNELNLSNVKFIYTGGDIGWKGDVPTFQYDISKILSTGWVPQYTSEEAVIKTVREICKL